MSNIRLKSQYAFCNEIYFIQAIVTQYFFCFSLECHYHLRGSQNRGDRTTGLTIKNSTSKKLGTVTTSQVLRANLSRCSLIPDESKYWDVFSSWQPLFRNGRKETNFYFRRKIEAGISYETLNVNLFCFIFNGVLKIRGVSEHCQASNMEFFYFRKKLHPRCLTGF